MKLILSLLSAIGANYRDVVRRLEQIDRKLDRLLDGNCAILARLDRTAADQQTIDRLTARLKAANDRLQGDVGSSTPTKE